MHIDYFKKSSITAIKPVKKKLSILNDIFLLVLLTDVRVVCRMI